MRWVHRSVWPALAGVAETFQVVLSEASGATLGNDAVVTLADRGTTGGGGAGTGVAIGPGNLKLDRRGRTSVSLRCPAAQAAGPCTGTLTVRTAKKVRIGGRLRVVRLGKATFSIPRGRTVKVVVRLSRRNVALVRRLKRVRVLVTAGKARRTVQLRTR